MRSFKPLKLVAACLSVLFVCELRAQDEKPLDGVLVRSPGSFSSANLYLSTDGNPVSPDLVKLIFPGGKETTKLMSEYLDRKIRVQGIMNLDKNVPTKDGKTINQRVVQVRSLRVAHKNANNNPDFAQQVIGKTATRNGRWLSVDHNNGLWWVDTKMDRIVQLFVPVKQDERSAINRTASCRLSPDEKILLVRQGLVENYIRLPEMEIVQLSQREPKGLQLFGGFSPDSKYVVLHHNLGKLSTGKISVYSLETGGLVINHTPNGQARFGETGFYQSGRKFFVEAAKTITVYEIPSGRRIATYTKSDQ